MSFDDWKEEQERIHNDYDAENAWYAGAKSRQAEIDELQKRIDKTVEYIECYYGVVELSMIVDMLEGK